MNMIANNTSCLSDDELRDFAAGRLPGDRFGQLLPRERGFDADWLNRFEREMQAVASLEHPNIVTATDANRRLGGWALDGGISGGDADACYSRDHARVEGRKRKE